MGGIGDVRDGLNPIHPVADHQAPKGFILKKKAVISGVFR
jgi:hypothetical protein